MVFGELRSINHGKVTKHIIKSDNTSGLAKVTIMVLENSYGFKTILLSH